LRDPDPTVRLRVAVALTMARDREAVPELITDLTDLPAEQAGRALEVLYQIAGDKGPETPLGEDAAARKQCRAAWATWWKANGEKADLARLTTVPATLGYTLLVEDGGGNGRVQEIGRDGKVRWQIEGLPYPVDAYVINGNRVLIAEMNGNRVTERDFKGNIVWQKQGLPGPPVNAQRLPNGNTFIATTSGLIEVDRSGKEVFRRFMPGQFLSAAYKARNGEMFLVLNTGMCIRLDPRGKEIKTFSSGRNGGWTSGIDMTPDGKILMSQPNRNHVAELDRDGKQLWQAQANGVITASRLPNGHVLFASQFNQNAVEIDRTGRVVWEHRSDRHLFRARRR
jgi:outer membrane protein assembly factor BamB